jgi:hypothetical protein
LGARRFSQRAQLTQRQSGTCTTLDWPDTGRAWWAADGAWSTCGRVERAAVQQRCPPAERDYPLAKGGNNTHTNTTYSNRISSEFLLLMVPPLPCACRPQVLHLALCPSRAAEQCSTPPAPRGLYGLAATPLRLARTDNKKPTTYPKTNSAQKQVHTTNRISSVCSDLYWALT